MAVSILINDQKKVVADVIPVALITGIDETKIYSGSEWLLCDGSAVSRTEYADLFAAVGTTFGPGDGTTTFNLPNANPTIVSGEKTFSQFITETVITVDNTAPIGIDISAGAVQEGIRVSIIETSAQTVTIYTDEAPHEQSCVLPKGMIVLEWDGGQWCLISETVRILVTITEDGTWKTPFGAVYTLRAIGGGGGGGDATASNGNAYAGGGAGGSCHQLSKYEPAGTTLTVSIGHGGDNSDNGGHTTLTDGSITLSGMGGYAGSDASAGLGTTNGSGGRARVRTTDKVTMSLVITGEDGYNGTGSKSGGGGVSANTTGFGGAGVNPNHNGNDGGAYGGGGSGGAVTGTGSKDGGDGADGVAYIEY
jgi:hypothetical protein